MARPRSKNKVVCQNSACEYFRKSEGKDVIKRGVNRAGHRQYFCLHCHHYFVETKGTPLYNKKLSERKIKAICKEIVETRGIRATERIVHVHRDTISRLINDLGNHAREMTRFLVHDLGLKTYEVDEIWAILKKNRDARNKKATISLERAKQSLRPA